MVRLLYAGLALTFLTLAVPIRLEGKWITLSFSVEGAILVWTGFRAASNFLRQAGYFLLAISGLRLLMLAARRRIVSRERPVRRLRCNGRELSVALWAARTHQTDVAEQERMEIGILAVAINVYALTALVPGILGLLWKSGKQYGCRTGATCFSVHFVDIVCHGAFVLGMCGRSWPCCGGRVWPSLDWWLGKYFCMTSRFWTEVIGFCLSSCSARCCWGFRSHTRANWRASVEIHDSTNYGCGAF